MARGPLCDVSTWGTEGGSYSVDGTYRWSFERTIGDNRRTICWIGLYPTTLDTEDGNRQSLQRMCNLSTDLGMGRLVLVNLFSLRCDDLTALKAAARDYERAVGGETNERIRNAAQRSDLVVAAWGNHGAIGARCGELPKILPSHVRKRLKCLGITSTGQPRQPSRLPNPLRLMPYGLAALQ